MMMLEINSSLDVHSELVGDDRSVTFITLACLLDLNLCDNVYYSISSYKHRRSRNLLSFTDLYLVSLTSCSSAGVAGGS